MNTDRAGGGYELHELGAEGAKMRLFDRKMWAEWPQKGAEGTK
jgi:hypothetical protein